MKVLLKEDIKSVGKKGDVINVSDGYARNYLLPRGLAIEADEGVIKAVKAQKQVQDMKQQKEKERAIKQAQLISEKAIVISAKCGDNGKLFGSVTNKELADELDKQMGIKVDKKKIELDEPIKSIGRFKANVKLYPGVEAELTIIVQAQ